MKTFDCIQTHDLLTGSLNLEHDFRPASSDSDSGPELSELVLNEPTASFPACGPPPPDLTFQDPPAVPDNKPLETDQARNEPSLFFGDESVENIEFIQPISADDSARQLYEEVLRDLLPLTLEQLSSLRREIDRRTKSQTAHPPIRQLNRVVSVSFEPEAVPPVITLAPDLATILVFTAQSGQPWPVTGAAYSRLKGSPADLNIYGCNKISLVHPGFRDYSNLFVFLDKMDWPILIQLEIKTEPDLRRQVDGVVHFRIPYAKSPFPNRENLNQSGKGHNFLCDFLAGLTPSDGTRLYSRPAGLNSCYFQPTPGGPIYVRTDMILEWPHWQEKVVGPGGLAVYKIPPTGLVISKNGQERVITELSAEPFEE
ncbi:MAG: DotH/IcmK family type IV secretion protein [Deltaproteobacteria bacterium]|nr:DotH/IcmK family type IV secretion protein [Deltaproteobacteria bacterium]